MLQSVSDKGGLSKWLNAEAEDVFGMSNKS